MRALMLVLLASTVGAQEFRPSVLVNYDSGQTVTIDMCASTGRNLRFGWDYDSDGADDQRGPCRRTVEQGGPIRVSIWEAVGEDHGRHEETIEPRGGRFAPIVTVAGGGMLGLGAVAAPATYTLSTCASDGPDVTTSFELEGDGQLEANGCEAIVRLFGYGDTAVVRVTIRSGGDVHVELVPLRVRGIYID
jgi:hypothetical protein